MENGRPNATKARGAYDCKSCITERAVWLDGNRSRRLDRSRLPPQWVARCATRPQRNCYASHNLCEVRAEPSALQSNPSRGSEMRRASHPLRDVMQMCFL